MIQKLQVEGAVVCCLTKKLEILSILLDDILVKYLGPSKIPLNGRGPGFAFALWKKEDAFLSFVECCNDGVLER